MATFSNIIRGRGVSKVVGISHQRQFLVQNTSNKNSWLSKRRYVF